MSPSTRHRPYPRRRPFPLALRLLLSTGGYLLIAAVAFTTVVFLTVYLYLTPARLTEIANTQASRFLKADVRLHNLDYRLRSTFPTLILTADSVEIYSRTLDSLPPAEIRQLPEGADFLASSGKLSLSLNVKETIRKNLVISDIDIFRPKANIVIVNDSANNFDILPPGLRLPKLNKMEIGRVHITAPAEITFADMPAETNVSTTIRSLRLKSLGKKDKSYMATLAAVVNGRSAGYALPRNLEVTFESELSPGMGDIAFSRGTRLGVAARNVKIPGAVRAEFPIYVEGTLPEGYILNLTSPRLPTFLANLDIPGGKVLIDTIPVFFNADLRVSYDNANPARSMLEINSVGLRGDGADLSLKGSFREILTKTPLADLTISGKGDLAKLPRMIPGAYDRPAEGDISASLKVKGRLDPKSAVMASGLDITGTIKSDSLTLRFPGSHTDLTLNGLNLAITGRQRKEQYRVARRFSTAATSENDRVVERNVAHSPIFLTADLPEKARKIIGAVDLSASLNVASGSLKTDAYPAANTFTDLLLETNLDSLKITSVDISTRGATAHLEGSAAGLRDFLLARSPAPLATNLSAGFSDVDINRLAGNYYAGQRLTNGHTPGEDMASNQTTSDSLCIVIPRNIAVNARLHADKAEYMQWGFSPLSADIILKDGDATLKDLSITAPYAEADIDWTYSTADLDSIFMSVKANVDNFDFRRFLVEFPEIACSWPQLQNLDADVSLHAAGSFLMFPTMYVNAPSIEGRATLDASGISFARKGRVEKMTHFMLIKGDTPLKVDTLHIEGAFHDNLLQVDPFTLECNGYRLLVGGVNNLQGEMYYHVGLLSNPFHLPFGVNIVGNYHHPGIRFGGRWIKDGRERAISSNLADDVNVNIMSELAHGWRMFVEKAAKYDAANNQSYISDVN